MADLPVSKAGVWEFESPLAYHGRVVQLVDTTDLNPVQ